MNGTNQQWITTIYLLTQSLNQQWINTIYLLVDNAKALGGGLPGAMALMPLVKAPS